MNSQLAEKKGVSHLVRQLQVLQGQIKRLPHEDVDLTLQEIDLLRVSVEDMELNTCLMKDERW